MRYSIVVSAVVLLNASHLTSHEAKPVGKKSVIMTNSGGKIPGEPLTITLTESGRLVDLLGHEFDDESLQKLMRSWKSRTEIQSIHIRITLFNEKETSVETLGIALKRLTDLYYYERDQNVYVCLKSFPKKRLSPGNEKP